MAMIAAKTEPMTMPAMAPADKDELFGEKSSPSFHRICIG